MIIISIQEKKYYSSSSSKSGKQIIRQSRGSLSRVGSGGHKKGEKWGQRGNQFIGRGGVPNQKKKKKKKEEDGRGRERERERVCVCVCVGAINKSKTNNKKLLHGVK